MTFADGSQRTTDYNATSDVTEYTDENGSVFEYTYDAIGRAVQVDITPAYNVAGYSGNDPGVTIQQYQYDGLSRITYAFNETSDAEFSKVYLYFDSLGRIVEESQESDVYGEGELIRDVTHHSFKSLTITGLTYPNDRTVAYNYDELYRLNKITDGSDNIARWSFYGPGRIAELGLGDDESDDPVLVCTHLNNARTNSAVQTAAANPAWGGVSSDRLGYDGAGRTITKRYVAYGLDGSSKAYSDPESEVGFTTAYDPASNKRYERYLHAESRSHLYPTLDSLNRLREYQRGTLALDSGGYDVTVSSAITLLGAESQRTYDLDGLGNWRRTDYTTIISGGTSDTEQLRRHNAANQVTKFGSTGVLYDGSPYAHTLLNLVTQEPKGYWRLGEDPDSGSAEAKNSAGGTHNGAYAPYSGDEWTGGTLGQPGALLGDPNTAADFNGSTGRVSITDHADFDFGTDMTAIVWIKGSAQATKIVAAHWDEQSNNRSWRLRSGTDPGDTDKIEVELTDNGSFSSGYRRAYRSSITVLDDQWHMVAFTFDSGTVRLFIDGVEDFDRDPIYTDNVTSLKDSSAVLTIGCHLDGSSDPAGFFDGTLDEVALFATVLTGDQLKDLYWLGKRQMGVPAGNGNISDDGVRLYTYDALNRLKRVTRKSNGKIIARYAYDAFGRRISKRIPEISGGNGGLNGDTPAGIIDYLYDGSQCIEERDVDYELETDTPVRQYVWGQYVDELIQQREINGGNPDYYLLSDLLYRAVALTDDEGAIVETYDCDAYGNTIAYDSAESGGWFSGDETATNNPKCQFIFTGRRFDPETSDATTQMYFYRARYYSPTLGRFISRDPIDYAGGMNLYEYVGNSPAAFLDAMGLTKDCDVKRCYELGNRYAELVEELENSLRPRARELYKKIPDYSRRIDKLRLRRDDLNESKKRVQQDANQMYNDMHGMLEQMTSANRKAKGITSQAGVKESLAIEAGTQVARYGLTKYAAFLVPGLNVAATVYGIYDVVSSGYTWIQHTEAVRMRDLCLKALNGPWFANKIRMRAEALAHVSAIEEKMAPIAAELLGLVIMEKAAKAEHRKATDKIKAGDKNVSKIFRCWAKLGCRDKLGQAYLADFATARDRGRPLLYKGD